MIYVILKEKECKDYFYKPYEHILYVTIDKDQAYNYFNNNCNGQKEYYNERYILREYKNMSEKYNLEIFKKDDTKYIEFINKEKQLEKLRKKEI